MTRPDGGFQEERSAVCGANASMPGMRAAPRFRVPVARAEGIAAERA